jgi:hypothetical protein
MAAPVPVTVLELPITLPVGAPLTPLKKDEA